tara:strand:- start:125 stop:682 length:558 start_codon:yes stop_codon:yes gene_type:complete
MKTDLFPSTITKHNLPVSDELRSKVLDIYNSQKFNSPKPFVLGPTAEVQELVKYYSDNIEEFLEEVEPNGKATVTDVSLVVLGSGDLIPRDCHLPGQYTAVHYISFDPTNHHADVYYHPAYDVLRCLGSDDLASGIWVQEGDLIFYPSYLHTSSPEHSASEERITLTFTFIIDAGRESSNQESSE